MTKPAAPKKTTKSTREKTGSNLRDLKVTKDTMVRGGATTTRPRYQP